MRCEWLLVGWAGLAGLLMLHQLLALHRYTLLEPPARQAVQPLGPGCAAVPLPPAAARPPLPSRLPPLHLSEQALGMSAGPAATVATSAAIKWITKDGLGAAGRLIVGGSLAQGARRVASANTAMLPLPGAVLAAAHSTPATPASPGALPCLPPHGMRAHPTTARPTYYLPTCPAAVWPAPTPHTFTVFDEDPRRWRMVAEGITTLGLSLEIATQVYPGALPCRFSSVAQ